MFPGRRSVGAVPQTRVELHAHLDGCVRHETIWELLKAKKKPLPGDGTFQALQEALVVRDPIDLKHFLRPFGIFTPAIAGDLSAVERVAYEFGVDKARRGVLYVEARYYPRNWLPPHVPEDTRMECLRQVVLAVNRGFSRAEDETGIMVRSILCVLNGNGDAKDILALCEHFRDQGVVGIDMATPFPEDSTTREEVPLTQEELDVFRLAKEKGIHRTVHAGESGGADMVQRAVSRYGAERIGHGYHVVDNPSIYHECRQKDIHFECCPWSSLLTGAVRAGVAKHPIAKFAEDEVNFSLNTDDTTVTGVTLQDDYDLASSWGLSEAHMVRANMNALRSSFLPAAEKAMLRDKLLAGFGINDQSIGGM